MSRCSALSLTLCFALLAGSFAEAQVVPPQVVEQLGLVQAWFRHVPAPMGIQSIADQQLFVHEEDPNEYVEIVAASTAGPEKQVLTRILTSRPGVNGQPLGLAEAQRLAGNEIRRLKRRGVEATTEVRKASRVRLYTVTTEGTLDCRDAETGEPVWSVSVGDRRLPFLAIGVGEKLLTVINGANLILVEASSGEVMEEIRTLRVPIFGAVNAGDYAMVPTFGSAIQGYRFDNIKEKPYLAVVSGNPLALPAKAPGTSRVAWGTDRGFVYVMELDGTPSVLFRLNTDGIVSGRVAAASGDRFYFGSEAGQVYGLRATITGQVMWNQPFGEPFYHEPYVIDNQLLIRSAYGNLYCLALDTGALLWDQATPNVADLIGSLGDHLFITNLGGSLAVLDKKTGKPTSIHSDIRPARFLVNTLTDRLYLLDESGNVQCLRPQNAPLPTTKMQVDAQPAAEATEPAKPKEEDSSPFGGESDMSNPFGATDAPAAADDANPFGDPDSAGEAGEEAMDSPFGDDNPFGG